MSQQESIDNIQKIYSYTKSPEVTRLLYAIFKEQIDKEFNNGNRFISIEFASTKRLVEWIEKADCSLPVVLRCIPTEKGIEYISKTYPNTVKVLKERNDVCAILLQTSMIIYTQCFAVTTILPSNIDVDSIKKQYPQHLFLKHQ